MKSEIFKFWIVKPRIITFGEPKISKMKFWGIYIGDVVMKTTSKDSEGGD